MAVKAKKEQKPIEPKPRFKTGAMVLVHNRPANGHCRTPWYLRGKTGVVSGVQGRFHDPERLAYHKPGLPAQVLYKVRFPQTHLWADYAGPGSDHLEADLSEDWLSPVKENNR